MFEDAVTFGVGVSIGGKRIPYSDVFNVGSEMITVIVGLKTLELDSEGDFVAVPVDVQEPVYAASPSEEPRTRKVEYVKPVKFSNFNRYSVYIAWTKEVAHSLGLPLEVFANQNDQIVKLTADKSKLLGKYVQLKTKLSRLDNSFWLRLKYLILGELYDT